MDHDPQALRQAIKGARKTQAEVAVAMGCSISLVSEWVAGTRNANDDRIDALADFLGCPRWVLASKVAS